MVPGSISTDAKEIFQEGLRLPAVKLVDGGQADRVGDARSWRSTAACPTSCGATCGPGIAAARVGERRLLELVERYGVETFLAGARALHGLRRAGRAARTLRELPKGTFSLAEEQDSGAVYKVTVDDHRRGVPRRPARQPRPGRRAEQRLAATARIVAAQMVFMNLTAVARVRERRLLPAAQAADAARAPSSTRSRTRRSRSTTRSRSGSTT